MKAFISCRTTSQGIHSFYLTYCGQELFLFQQNYRHGVDEFFSKGVELNQAIRFSHAHHDSAIIRTMEKLPLYIRYIEKEHAIAVLDQTIKTNTRYGHSAA